MDPTPPLSAPASPGAAEKGDAQAASVLAHMYLLGAMGVRADPALAADYFKAAAEGPDSMIPLANLGYLYLHGLGVEKDPTTARELLREPADAGLASAVTALGTMYLTGEGEVSDPATAFALFRRAAEAGHADAHFNLGLMYLQGSAPSVGRDFRLAAHHFKTAASAAHVRAAYALGAMQAHGVGGPRDCAGALASYRSVLARLPQSAEMPNAAELLVAGNPGGALLEYLRAAEQGIEAGGWNAAYLLDRGLVPQGAVTAGQSVGRAGGDEGQGGEGAGEGHGEDGTNGSSAGAQREGGGDDREAGAQQQEGGTEAGGAAREQPGADGLPAAVAALWTRAQRLAPWLLPRRRSGTSSPGAQRRALRLLHRSTALGNAWAEVALGDAHYYGRGGLPVSHEAAVERYLAACNAHVPEGCWGVGWMYQHGQGLATDRHLAKRYYDLCLEHQKTHR